MSDTGNDDFSSVAVDINSPIVLPIDDTSTPDVTVSDGSDTDMSDTDGGGDDGPYAIETLSFENHAPAVVAITEAADDKLMVTRGYASSLDLSVLLGNDTTMGATPTIRFGGEVGLSVMIDNGKLIIVTSSASSSFDYLLTTKFGSSLAHVTVQGVVSTDGADNLGATDGITGADLQSHRGDDALYGSMGADHLRGGDGYDSLYGGGGNDYLQGQDGEDVLDGGTGADRMDGGAGNDSYYVDNVGDMIIDASGEDVVITTLNTYTLGSTLENLRFNGAGNFSGYGNAGNNILVGGAGDDYLSGKAGDDVLNGGLGADKMNGGAGNDVYYVDNTGDVIVDASGSDFVYVSLDSYTLTSGIENLTYSGTGAFTGTGNALDNRLNGGDGNDILKGLDGNDVLSGGRGGDRMEGGAGDDIYFVDNARDTIVDTSGFDYVYTTLNTYSLGSGLEFLSFQGAGDFTGFGNSDANTVVGGGGNNILSGLGGDDRLTSYGGNDILKGGTGADYMQGGDGDDTYYVDNIGDQTPDTGGHDQVMVSLTTYTLSADIEDLTYTGTSAFTGSGNALNNSLTGGGAADHLMGLGGDDVLIGGGGGDVLVGGAGVDTLTGGAGKDYFVLTAASDSGVGVGVHDVITDFASNDELDFSAIDADTSLDGDQAFTFLGTGAFTHAAGQVNYAIDGAGTHVYGDIDGDGLADFEVLLLGSHSLNAGDFIL